MSRWTLKFVQQILTAIRRSFAQLAKYPQGRSCRMTKYFECALLPVHVVISSVLCAIMVWSNSTFNLRAVVSSHGSSNFCEIIGTSPEFACSSGSDPQQCFAAVEQFAYDWIFYVFNVAYPTRACSFIGTNGNDAKTDHWDATNSDSTVAFYATNDVTIGFSMQCIHVFHVFFSTWWPGVGNLFTQPLTFVQSALGSSGTLCDPSHGLPGSSPGPLVQSAVLPAGPGPSVLTPSGPEPKRRRLDLQPDPLHESPTRSSSWATKCYKLSSDSALWSLPSCAAIWNK